MALSSGARFGHYDVTALLGEGGMGQVWQATDTRLNRQVALKIMPAAFASDPDRLARFEREAKVLASLNHPNIAAIHGLEESGPSASDGSSSGQAAKALVLELVEGPTLADRIAQGPIPLDDALPIATQIAEALEAAHEAGIIHRDLKPANIKVRPDGTVKVLDFGLAKALDPAPESDPSQSPTLTAAATKMGVILGTAAYMSPEQARGKPVDKRADIWAFGVVLYEMLCGARPFHGATVSEVLAEVLKSEPNWDRFPDAAPAHIRQVVRRCLQKEPRDRLHHVADLRLALAGAFEADASPASGSEPRRPSWTRPMPLLVAGLGLALMGGAFAWLTLTSATERLPPLPIRFSFALPESDSLPNGVGTLVALSPDGRTLVYGATRDGTQQLYRRPVDEFVATPLAGTEDGRSPVISSDGTWIIYQAGRSRLRRSLRRVPVTGGAVQILEELPDFGLASNWGPDDEILVTLDTGELMQLPASGGEGTVVATADDGTRFGYPHVLPDGDATLVTVVADESVDPNPTTGDLYVLSLESGERRLVLPDAIGGRLLSSGHLVFLRSAAIWAVGFDLHRLEVVGTPVPVLDDVRVDVGHRAQFAIAGDGSLAYVPRVSRAGRRQLLSIDRSGRPEVVGLSDQYGSIALSPDGRHVALGTPADSENPDIWVSELARPGSLARVTTDPAFDGAPLWSPDGRKIVFTTTRNGRQELMWASADGTGSAETLATFGGAAERVVAYDFLADGQTMLVSVDQSGVSRRDIGTVTIDSGDGWEPLLETAADEAMPTISPNGRWLAYSLNDGGYEVHVARYPGLEDTRPVSIGGGHAPRWSADGRTLYYLRAPSGPADALMRVSIAEGKSASDPLNVGTPEVVFPWSYFNQPGGQRRYAVSESDDRFFVIGDAGADGGGPDGPQINVVLNWVEELHARVPIP